MLFTSYVFILGFLPVVFFGFVWLRGRSARRAAIVWIVFASAFFYGWWSWKHLALLVGLLIFNYAAGFPVRALRGTAGGRIVLGGAIAANLGALAWFKYAAFFGGILAPGLASAWRLEAIVLPLAISFFTFQKIAYLADVWSGEVEPPGFWEFCFFVLFFPQLVAGPIVHCKDIVPQIRSPAWARLDERDVAAGWTIFLIGLCKKAFLADPLSTPADLVFGLAAEGTAPAFERAWLGTLAFAFQIYFDFSAYSDMAIGLALMFGVRLPVNFNSPYKAADPVEFWRRWHISLSTWLRDYLYVPLGGNRVSRSRRALNVMIVMALGGLWHGASWTFLVWGVLHGIMILAAQGLRERFGEPRSHLRLATGGATFVFVVLAWVLFRSPDFSTATVMFGALAEVAAAGGTTSIREWAPVALAAAICWLAPNTMRIFALVADRGAPAPVWLWRPNAAWAVLAAAAFVAFLAYVPAGAPFIYFQF